MTTTILLIRHGQTDWNANQRWQGHADTPLNKTGHWQAQQLAQRLRNWPIQTIYSSDLRRTQETAYYLAQALGQEIILNDQWRERDLGDFSGLTTDEIKTTFPDEWAQRGNGVLNPPNGERYEELYARGTAVFQDLLTRHNSNEMIAVVSHGALLATVISSILGIPPTHHPRFSLRGNTGISTVEINDGSPRLFGLNDTCHLNQ